MRGCYHHLFQARGSAGMQRWPAAGSSRGPVWGVQHIVRVLVLLNSYNTQPELMKQSLRVHQPNISLLALVHGSLPLYYATCSLAQQGMLFVQLCGLIHLELIITAHYLSLILCGWRLPIIDWLVLSML